MLCFLKIQCLYVLVDIFGFGRTMATCPKPKCIPDFCQLLYLVILYICKTIIDILLVIVALRGIYFLKEFTFSPGTDLDNVFDSFRVGVFEISVFRVCLFTIPAN